MNQHSQTNDRPPKYGLIEYVIERLPDDFLLTGSDEKWLELCDSYLSEYPTNANVLAATKAALRAHPTAHFDPFELLIEAGICDVDCQPLP